MSSRTEWEQLHLELHDNVNTANYQAIRALVRSGADVNHRDVVGDTPLIEAAWIGAPHIVQLLLDYGADIHSVGRDGKTALAIALEALQDGEHSSDHAGVIQVLRAAGMTE